MRHCILFLLLITAISFGETDKDTLLFNNMGDTSTFGYHYLNELFSIISDSLDIIPRFVKYPRKRAIVSLKEDHIDVEMSRVYQFGEHNPELHRVPVSFVSTNFSAYSLDSSLTLHEWKSLEEKRLKIDYIRGSFLVEKRIRNLNKKVFIYPLNSVSAAMERLLLKRSDLLIISEPQAEGWLLTNPEKAKMIYHVGIMEEVNIYCYLSPKNKHLLKPFTRILSHMKEEGILDSLWGNAKREWINLQNSPQKDSAK